MSSNSFELDKNILIRAGAGAGKTTTLVDWFINYNIGFHKKNGRYPKVIITTFTRKATQEVKERLLKEALKKNQLEIFKNISNSSKVHISTIHGVLGQYLNRYFDRIGFSNNYNIIDDELNRKLAKTILRNYLDKNDEFLFLLEKIDFNILLETLLKYFECELTNSDFKRLTKDDYIKIIENHLKKIQGQLGSLSEVILAQCNDEKWTNYLSQLKGLTFENKLNGFLQRYQSIKESPSPRFMKKNPPFDENLKNDLDSVKDQIEELLESESLSESYIDSLEEVNFLFEKLAKTFVKDFLENKMKNSFITMGELETFSKHLMDLDPETATSFSEEWDYWMIDEYQDTSPLQVEILRSLIGKSKHFIVGDPQQSIYLFRGARSEVFYNKEKEIQDNSGQRIERLDNYRSRPEVLKFINYFFTRLPSKFSAMNIDESRWESKPSIIETPIRILFSEQKSRESHINSVVSEIQYLMKKGISPEKICVLSRNNLWLEELAIACSSYGIDVQVHSNSKFYQRREVIDALSLLKLFLNPHDNLNLLTILRAPWIPLSDDQILKLIKGQSKSFWFNLRQNLKAILDKEFMSNLLGTESLNNEILLSVFKIIESFDLSKSLGIGFCFQKVLMDLGIIDLSRKIDLTGRREANLWKIIATVNQEERSQGLNYFNIIKGISKKLSSEVIEEGDALPVLLPSRINLMTIHNSKGLQFESVILMGMHQSSLPAKNNFFAFDELTNTWSLSLYSEEDGALAPTLFSKKIREDLSQREKEESLRVLYVALTRAISTISLISDSSYSKSAWMKEFEMLDLSLGEKVKADIQYDVLLAEPPQILNNSQFHKKMNQRMKWKSEDTLSIEKKSVTSQVEIRKNFQKISESEIQENLSLAIKGTHLHRIFELLKYHKPEILKEKFHEDKVNEMIDYLASLTNPPILEIISRGYVEWGYSYQQGNDIIQGQIDLWGIVGAILWIVDYKTGSSKYSEKAFEQLAFYADALQKIYPDYSKYQVNLLVIYPAEKILKMQELLPHKT